MKNKTKQNKLKKRVIAKRKGTCKGKETFYK